MSQQSTIEWTDATWNPVTGCTKISPGCKNCYAETFAERFRGVPGHPYEQGFDLRLWPSRLEAPLRWRKPRMIFVNSMSDLFHEDVPDEYIARVFRVMAEAKQHTFQVLTKRAKRLAAWHAKNRSVWYLPNVWLGVSVEDQQYGLPRIAHLRDAHAAVRFLSIEPLLEDLGEVDLRGIDWVIVGGESGRRSRAMEGTWALSMRDQCLAEDVPFFFKQWGGFRKKRNGRQLEDRTWDELPSMRRTASEQASL